MIKDWSELGRKIYQAGATEYEDMGAELDGDSSAWIATITAMLVELAQNLKED